MRSAFLRKTRFWVGFLFFLFQGTVLKAQTVYPEALTGTTANQLTSAWLVFDSDQQKYIPYLSDESEEHQAIHQWVLIKPEYPFEVSFPAARGLCIFLNNQLIFSADSTATYTLDLSTGIQLDSLSKNLLTVWHPEIKPNVLAFSNLYSDVKSKTPNNRVAAFSPIKIRNLTDNSVFIVFLLLISFIYGSLRTSFAADFSSVVQIGKFLGRATDDEGFLSKPIISWPGILFILAFSMSFAVLVVAIQLYGINHNILNQLLTFSGSDVFSKVVANTALIFGIVLLRYLYLAVTAYIFGFSEVVGLQYQEFLRGILFMGLLLPFILIFYLVYHSRYPLFISGFTGVILAILLIVTVLRVIYVLNNKATILNLHFFAYLCATEIIPLAIVLKLIFLNY